MGTTRLYACIVELDEELKKLNFNPEPKDIVYVQWLASESRRELDCIFIKPAEADEKACERCGVAPERGLSQVVSESDVDRVRQIIQ